MTASNTATELPFEPPGPGSWEQDAVHFPRAMTRYFQETHPLPFKRGTTDFAYPLDSYQKSYRLVDSKLRHVSVAVNRPHGHIWTFPEVDAFVGSVLRGEPALPRVGAVQVKDGLLLRRWTA